MTAKSSVFVDSGAWIALALTQDPYHLQAKTIWSDILNKAGKIVTSVPVAIETFTFLERNAERRVALSWKEQLKEVPRLSIAECKIKDLEDSWSYFNRRDLFKLSAVDATSFVIMTRLKIKTAFAFDYHFSKAGFNLLQ